MADPRWITDGFDLHLVAPAIGSNQTRTYNLGNWFLPDGSTAWTTNNGGFVDPFRGVFNFVENPHKVSIAPNGILTFFGSAPQPPNNTPPLRNFIVNVIRPGTAPPIPLRIHRHEALLDFELTPPSLTVRRTIRTPTVGFSVLAKFRDIEGGQNYESVGDISLQPDNEWRSAGGVISVGDTGMIGVIVGQENKTATAELVLGASLFPAGQLPLEPQRTKSATVKTLTTWGDTASADPTEVKLIRGPGYFQIANVPNVLILPDGIVENDRTEWEKLVVDIVDRISYYATAVPYKQLIKTNAINFWMGWVASPESGGTVLDLSRPTRPGETGFAPNMIFDLNPARRLNETAAVTTLEELFYRVGYPTMFSTTVLTFEDQFRIWTNQFGTNATYLSGIDGVLWDQWRRSLPGVLLRERDTTFGISIGERPRMPDEGKSAVGWHPRRIQRAELEQYLGRLFTKVDGTDQPMGPIWITPPPRPPGDPPPPPPFGKDRTLVAVIANSPRQRGTETPENLGALVATTLTSEPFVTLATIPTVPDIFSVAPLPLPAAVGVTTIGSLLHELGHTFNLGDEYHRNQEDVTPDEVTRVRDRKLYWNLVSIPDVQAGGNIQAGRIRWSNWPRIVAAGVVNAIPTNDGGSPLKFTIQLRPGHRRVFEGARVIGRIPDGATLRFRMRPLVQSVSPTNDDLNVLGPAMTFDALDSAQDDRITVFGDASVVSWIVDRQPQFTDGRIILLAARQETAGAEQYVLHTAVGQTIQGNRAPLNRAANDLNCVMPQPDAKFRALGVDTLPANIKRPPNLRRMIGLYDGGKGFSCGLFHAAGECTMNDANGTEKWPPGLVNELRDKPIPIVTPLCHVCRYILVDHLSPTLHGVIDDLYSRDYPL